MRAAHRWLARFRHQGEAGLFPFGFYQGSKAYPIRLTVLLTGFITGIYKHNEQMFPGGPSPA